MKVPDKDRTLAAVRSRLDKLSDHDKAGRRARMNAVIKSVRIVPDDATRAAALASLEKLARREALEDEE